MSEDIYGQILVSTGPIPTVSVDRISGGRIERDKKGKPTKIHLHYKAKEKYHVLTVNFLDGMYLLSVLKCIQLDTNTPFPDDPREYKATRH